ncbi:class I SAM-dependent methyltransferase, partial [Rothia dentocariosa]|uniref:class I SAM-dependent methyltransferase n=2 Tax=Rothia dentocariosa TaxID=2047 RepID=UPI001454FDC3
MARYAVRKLKGSYSSPEADYNNVASTYDKHYQKSLAAGLNNFISIIEKDIEKLNRSNFKVILELAAGTGESSRDFCLSSITDFCSSYYLVDKSHEMLKINKNKNIQNFSDRGIKMTTYCEDAIEYMRKLPDNSIDVLLCAWGVCYINSSDLKKEILRVMRKNGYIALIENRMDSLKEVESLFFNILKENPRLLDKAVSIKLPKNSESMSKAYLPEHANIITKVDREEKCIFKNTSDLLTYLMESGVSAGYIDAISSDKRDVFVDMVRNYIERIGAENLPVICLLYTSDAADE